MCAHLQPMKGEAGEAQLLAMEEEERYTKLVICLCEPCTIVLCYTIYCLYECMLFLLCVHRCGTMGFPRKCAFIT